MEHFQKLFAINCNDKTEKKSNGSVELTYLSWCYAWSEVKKIYPDATYEIEKFENNLPYTFDEKTGYMVFTKVSIEGITYEMWLPVMDSANKAMKDKPYTYKVKKWNAITKKYDLVEKNVEVATMFDINKTIMRCLTKNLAMFGLGLYIYAGEDLPEDLSDDEVEKSKKETKKKTSTKKEEVSQEQNYRQELISYCQEKKIDMNNIAKEYKINAKSTQDDFKHVLLELKVKEN